VIGTETASIQLEFSIFPGDEQIFRSRLLSAPDQIAAKERAFDGTRNEMRLIRGAATRLAGRYELPAFRPDLAPPALTEDVVPPTQVMYPGSTGDVDADGYPDMAFSVTYHSLHGSTPSWSTKTFIKYGGPVTANSIIH
jgi:hypothetical protein